MKANICSICLNSDMLCMACKKKLDAGQITESDIRFSRMVHEAAKSFRPLDSIEIKRVIDGRDFAVIICGSGEKSRLIGRDGSMVKKLSKAAGKAIRVVEDTKDPKAFVRDLISPVPLLGVNVLYSQEGEFLKVIIPKGRKIPMSRDAFAEIMMTAFGKKVVVENV